MGWWQELWICGEKTGPSPSSAWTAAKPSPGSHYPIFTTMMTKPAVRKDASHCTCHFSVTATGH